MKHLKFIKPHPESHCWLQTDRGMLCVGQLLNVYVKLDGAIITCVEEASAEEGYACHFLNEKDDNGNFRWRKSTGKVEIFEFEDEVERVAYFRMRGL